MTFQFTRIYAFCILIQCITIESNAQDNCYSCNRDSIIRQLPLIKKDVEKIKALSIVIDFSPTADSANYYIEQLLPLNKKYRLVDDGLYQKIAEANTFYLKKEYRNALEAYKYAVKISDKKRKINAALLLGFRNVFNLLNIQEERLEYYKEKLNYYLINGPYENTAACYHGIGGYYTYTADYNQAISFYLKGSEVFKRFYPYWYYNALGIVGVYYAEWGNEKKAWQYFNHALPVLDSLRFLSPTNERNKAFYDVALSRLRLKEKNYKEAMLHADFVISDFKQNSTNRFYAIGLLLKGLVYISTNEPSKAYPLLTEAKKISDSVHNGRMTTFNSTLEIDYGLYKYSILVKDQTSAAKYLLQAYKRAVEETSNELQLKYLKELSAFYLSQNQLSLGKKYNADYFTLKEKIEDAQSNFKIAQYENEKKQLDQLANINALKNEKEKIQLQNKIRSKENLLLVARFVIA